MTPNRALNQTRRFVDSASRASARRAGYVTRWASVFYRSLRRLRVVHRRPHRRAERRLCHIRSGPSRLDPCCVAMEQALGRIASMPAIGNERTSRESRSMARARPSTVSKIANCARRQGIRATGPKSTPVRPNGQWASLPMGVSIIANYQRNAHVDHARAPSRSRQESWNSGARRPQDQASTKCYAVLTALRPGAHFHDPLIRSRGRHASARTGGSRCQAPWPS
jgi:hypothetical protein